MDPTLEQLRTLMAVVDQGTLEAAAVRLSITPSAVSQRIKALEHAVGRTVLVRSKPVEVTETATGLVRLARQIDLLTGDTLAALGLSTARQRLSLVINSDSFATWVMPALAAVAEKGVAVEVLREDQELSAELLRRGSVMGAITSQAEPIAGCSVRPLGIMGYHPMATAQFSQRWFGDGLIPQTLRAAPVVVFDRVDDLQDRFLAGHGVSPADPPRHYIPESACYADAVRHGLGWGMLPRRQQHPELIQLSESTVDVRLFWQQWKLDSPALAMVGHQIARYAAQHLAPVQ